MIVSDPQVVQDIFTSPHCVNKGIIYKAVDDGAGVGLFSLKGVCLWNRVWELLKCGFV